MPVMLNQEDIATIPAKEAVTAPVLWVLQSQMNGQRGPTGPITHTLEICPMTLGGVLVQRDAANNSLVQQIVVPDVFAMVARCPEYAAHINAGFAAILAVKAILDQDAADAEAARVAALTPVP